VFGNHGGGKGGRIGENLCPHGHATQARQPSRNRQRSQRM
jgi:hypothetical protein